MGRFIEHIRLKGGTSPLINMSLIGRDDITDGVIDNREFSLATGSGYVPITGYIHSDLDNVESLLISNQSDSGDTLLVSFDQGVTDDCEIPIGDVDLFKPYDVGEVYIKASSGTCYVEILAIGTST